MMCCSDGPCIVVSRGFFGEVQTSTRVVDGLVRRGVFGSCWQFLSRDNKEHAVSQRPFFLRCDVCGFRKSSR